ncbi:MAG: ABC transporter ATP-binding protein [Armatimonadetes bacterium]|jgi:ABC-type polysaccharide/polyol phosphate transport system ATPase subunit|nr:ABC transporter ATP-binding protein [Armatimonadota bacterium]
MNVISVENVSKKFILSHDRPKNLADMARGMLRRRVREDFWALKDITFDVKQGEALGIIGHNGAGKSTMLKLLTRIMNPTKGRIRTRGRVSALIEVGAGFHPEMTGRENIYLNGSILGMTQREIANKFDEIVAFAELEKFIDTPVKRYSSGMYARLGFAVAAHVDPEILIVDEVLSVGDAAFQERCTKRMRQLRSSDKTIVFVSHNMGAVTSLCDRVAVLDHGLVKEISDGESAVRAYRELVAEHKRGLIRQTHSHSDAAEVPLSPLRVTKLEHLGDNADWVAEAGLPLGIRVHFEATELIESPRIGVFVTDGMGRMLAHTSNAISGNLRDVSGPGYYDVMIRSLPLVPDVYTVVARIADAYGVLLYDEGFTTAELTVIPPKSQKDTGAPRYGIAWLDADWIYH